MSIPLFLAMTGEEIREATPLPPRIAWFSCHFSAHGAGLTGIPGMVPAGSMLILDDRIPVRGHDAALVAAHLEEIVKKWDLRHVLLDFERPATPEVSEIVRKVIQQLPCPVGVSKDYACDLDCPVFLPPVPPHLPVEEYLSPWKSREIWLEMALDGSNATITSDGCKITPVPFPEPEDPSHYSQELHSHYHITTDPERIQFAIHRTPQDLSDLLDAAERSGVTLAVGLYQELGITVL